MVFIEKTITITVDTYSHVMTDMQEGATGVMNNLFENNV